MEVIGKKDSLYFVIEHKDEGGLRQVENFYKDLCLTPVDKTVYIPQFCHSMRMELEELTQRKINPDRFFLSLGPTTDDCSCRISLTGEEARLSFDIDNEVVQVAIMPTSYLINTYSRVISRLEASNAEQA